MTWLGRLLLRSYLGLFAFFAPHREHARREHALIEISLRESYDGHRSRGSGVRHAAFVAILDHLAELSPLALYRKTRADAAYAPGGERSGGRWPEAVVFAIGGLLAFATVNSIDRSSNPPYWVFVALLPAVAGTAVMLSITAALRRRAPLALVVVVSALGLWPLWQRLLPMMDGAAAAAMSAVTLLLVAATLRHRARGWGAALLVLAPVVPAGSRSLGLRVLGSAGEFGRSDWEMVAFERIAALTVYLLLLALALRLLSRRSAPHRASKGAN